VPVGVAVGPRGGVPVPSCRVEQRHVGRVRLPSASVVVSREQHRLGELVQSVEVDVGKDRADHAALRAAAERGMILPVLQVSGLEQFGQQPQEAVVVELLVQGGQEDRMIQPVEALNNVALDIPLDPSPMPGDLPQGGVAASVGPEAVGVPAELRLVIRLQEGANHFL
jgi:hypothetical protein